MSLSVLLSTRMISVMLLDWYSPWRVVLISAEIVRASSLSSRQSFLRFLGVEEDTLIPILEGGGCHHWSVRSFGLLKQLNPGHQ